ncbi:hypothetical protein M5E88_06305 [Akkermansia muciniphila]|nr:hypothetical protein M5E88_06305 [Akkermansia muciniphila]
MSVPSGSRNFNCWRNCAGSGAASLPVTPWATTSREASLQFLLQGGGPKTNTAASRSPYGFKNKFRMLPAPGIQRTKQFRQCLRHRHAALHEDRVNPDYTIARRQIRRRQAAERRLPDTIA